MKRDKKGRFTSNNKFAWIMFGLVLAVSGAVFFNHSTIMASIDSYSKSVEVTAEVAVNCTSPTHIYTEECVKRLTDDIAESFVDLKKAEKLLREAQTLYDTTFEAHEESVERLNTFKGL